MVARDVAGVALCGHQPRVVAEALPDARSRAVGERRTLDLTGGGRRAPQAIVSEQRLRPFLYLSALTGDMRFGSSTQEKSAGTGQESCGESVCQEVYITEQITQLQK